MTKKKKGLTCPLCGNQVKAGRMQAHKRANHSEYQQGWLDAPKSTKATDLEKGAQVSASKKKLKGSVLTGLAGKTSSRNWKHTK